MSRLFHACCDNHDYHRIDEIESDIVLPPLRELTVLLDLDKYALMSFNLLQALVAVNAVDSERTDMVNLFRSETAQIVLYVLSTGLPLPH